MPTDFFIASQGLATELCNLCPEESDPELTMLSKQKCKTYTERIISSIFEPGNCNYEGLFDTLYRLGALETGFRLSAHVYQPGNENLALAVALMRDFSQAIHFGLAERLISECKCRDKT